MKALITLLFPFVLAACNADESVSKFVDPDAEYHLIELDGATFAARATIAFPEQGKVIGQAPCNRFFAQQSVPYPWFSVEAIGATRMACAELETETHFFAALEDMTLAEVQGGTLILSNDVGRRMVFEAR